VILKLSSATALLLTAFAVQAQGVVSPVPGQKAPPAVIESTPTVQTVASPAAGFNPFKPPAPPTTPAVDPILPPPPPPVDPVIAAIAEELQTIREQGERLGKINGKTIFRYEGRYLIEAATPEESADGALFDLAKRQAVLSGDCVVRVVTDSSKHESSAAAVPASQN
jgi:hypothetical protein